MEFCACFSVKVIILEVKFKGNQQVKQYAQQVALNVILLSSL